MPDFLDDLSSNLGGRITSTYRSQAEQDALVRSGATSTKHSTHTDGNGFDYVPKKGQTADQVNAAITALGYPGSHIIDESGHGPNQGTGSHLHISNPNFKGAFLPGATPSSPNVPTVTQTAASTGPVAPAADPLNPFTASPVVSAAVTQTTQALHNLNDVVTKADGALSQVQAERATAMTESVGKRTAIVNDQDQATQELQTKVAPIFAQRASIAQRQVELAQMSPLKREILGIFSRKYNPDRLAEIDHALAGQASEAGAEYQFATSNRDMLIKDIETRQQGTDALSALQESSANLDKSIANDGFTLATQNLSNAILGIKSGTEVTAAQVQARDVALSQMDPKQLNTAISEAKANGGSAMVNGTPISMAELTHRSQQLQEQDIQLSTAKLGLQAQQLNVQDAAERRLIEHMSPADLQTAINNGGMYHGHTLNQNALTQAFSMSQARTQGLVQQSLTNIDGTTYAAGIDRLNAQNMETARRIQGISGIQVPTAYKSFINSQVATAKMWADKIKTAPEAAKNDLRAAALADIGKRNAGLNDVIDNITNGMTRNKDTQLLLKGWMTGNPVTGQAAAAGLIGMFQGGNGVPKGMKLNGPEAQMFQAAQAAYNGVMQKYGGQQSMADIMAGKGKVTKDQFNREVMESVTQAAGSAWNNAQAGQIMPQIPQIAKQSGHPAGNIRPADLAGATHLGDQAATQAMATRLGWTPDQVEQVFGQGGSKAGGYQAIAVKGGKAAQIPYAQATRMYQLDTNTNMLRALDASPSARPGFVPSHALTDFMNSAGFNSTLSSYGSNLPHTSFGSFVGDGISNGTIPDLIGAHGQALHQAVGNIASQDQARIRGQVALYQNDPLKRAGVILAAIPGLNGQDQKALIGAIQGQVSSGAGALDNVNQYMGGGFITSSAVGDQIDSTILHGKFQDPHLEKLRKTAAAHWNEFQQHSDSIVERLLKGVFGSGGN